MAAPSLVSTTVLQNNAWPSLVTSGSVNVSAETNSILIVKVAVNHGDTGPGESIAAFESVQYNGHDLTHLASAGSLTQVAPYTYEEIWYIVNPDTGNNTLTITHGDGTQTTGNRDCIAFAELWKDVNQDNPVSDYNTATGGNGGTVTVDVNSAVGEVVTDFVGARQNRVFTVGSGQTSSQTGSQGSGGGMIKSAASYEDGAASVTMNWTGGGASDAEWATIALSLAPALVATTNYLVQRGRNRLRFTGVSLGA